MSRKRVAVALGLLLASWSAPLHACPVCFGAADGPILTAARTGVLVMAAVTCAVLAAFAAFFVRMARRRAS